MRAAARDPRTVTGYTPKVAPPLVATALLFAHACAPSCARGGDARAHYEAAVAAPDAPAFEAALAHLDDPVVRDAAILTWVAAHRDDVPVATAHALCGRVSPPDVNTCLRRVDAAHLGR
jgi:hypothetical protein